MSLWDVMYLWSERGNVRLEVGLLLDLTYIHYQGSKKAPWDTMTLTMMCLQGRSQGDLSPRSKAHLPPWATPLKWHFTQGSMESRHFESRSVPLSPHPLLAVPLFWKVWLHPCVFTLLPYSLRLLLNITITIFLCTLQVRFKTWLEITA